MVIVGCLMAGSLKKIKWHDPAHAATAFLTVIIMPLTYSIAYGLFAGIACWMCLQTLFKVMSLFGIERPVFEEIDENQPLIKPDETTRHAKEDEEVEDVPEDVDDDGAKP